MESKSRGQVRSSLVVNIVTKVVGGAASPAWATDPVHRPGFVGEGSTIRIESRRSREFVRENKESPVKFGLHAC